MDTRCMTLLDETGDTSVAWDESADDKMLKIIEQRMSEGFIFYIVKPFPILNVRRMVKAKSVEEIKAAGGFTIKDKQLEQLFLEGSIGTTKSKNEETIQPIKKATSAREVAMSHSVGTRPMRGG